MRGGAPNDDPLAVGQTKKDPCSAVGAIVDLVTWEQRLCEPLLSSQEVGVQENRGVQGSEGSEEAVLSLRVAGAVLLARNILLVHLDFSLFVGFVHRLL